MTTLDASALIAFLTSCDAHHARAVTALDELATESFSASVMTLAEIFVHPVRRDAVQRARRSLAPLEITTVGIAAEDTVALAVLRERTGLVMPDCCVLLAAQRSDAHAVLSFDDPLRAASREMGLDTPG